ncbi:MAG: hypothetical protein ACLQVD_15830 [Capsulimonadaceae bacterium]
MVPLTLNRVTIENEFHRLSNERVKLTAYLPEHQPNTRYAPLTDADMEGSFRRIYSQPADVTHPNMSLEQIRERLAVLDCEIAVAKLDLWWTEARQPYVSYAHDDRYRRHRSSYANDTWHVFEPSNDGSSGISSAKKIGGLMLICGVVAAVAGKYELLAPFSGILILTLIPYLISKADGRKFSEYNKTKQDYLQRRAELEEKAAVARLHARQVQHMNSERPGAGGISSNSQGLTGFPPRYDGNPQ